MGVSEMRCSNISNQQREMGGFNQSFKESIKFMKMFGLLKQPIGKQCNELCG